MSHGLYKVLLRGGAWGSAKNDFPTFSFDSFPLTLLLYSPSIYCYPLPQVFLPPALCDMTATSVQYIGLTLTYASSFQMLRGAVIIFTGIIINIYSRII